MPDVLTSYRLTTSYLPLATYCPPGGSSSSCSRTRWAVSAQEVGSARAPGKRATGLYSARPLTRGYRCARARLTLTLTLTLTLAPNPRYTSPHLTSLTLPSPHPHLTSRHLASPHSHLTSPHLTSAPLTVAGHIRASPLLKSAVLHLPARPTHSTPSRRRASAGAHLVGGKAHEQVQQAGRSEGR